ncbi:MAG: hypothetical protein AAF607_05160 [Pseudomonadota bacterium]
MAAPFKTRVLRRLLSRRRFLDEETALWALEHLGWVLDNFGGIEQLQNTALVLPTDAFFPFKDDSGHDRAKRLFTAVKQHANMQDWPCELAPLPERAPNHINEIDLQVFDAEKPAGQIHLGIDTDTPPLIEYDPRQLDDAQSFVATCAHELAHYLMISAKQWGPGGIDLHEHATDALAIHMAFGLFLANSAFHVQQYSGALASGYSYRRQGYLTQDQLIYVLALFLAIKSETANTALQYLKPRLQKALKRALKDIHELGDVASAAVDAWQNSAKH